MTNPYAVTTLETNREDRPPSMPLGFAFGVLGYLAPFVCLFSVALVSYGTTSISDNFFRILRMHQSFKLPTVIAFVPNLVCMISFGIAGYRRLLFQPVDKTTITVRTLGIATILGYCAMVIVPLPWWWTSMQSNLTRTALAVAFTSFLLAFRWIQIQRTTGKPEA